MNDYVGSYYAPTGSIIDVVFTPRVDEVPDLAFMTTGCHPMCNTCNGPDIDDCITCNNNASGTPCKCKDGWIGVDCSVWQNECNPKCDTCSGPDETDCVECTANAYKDATG